VGRYLIRRMVVLVPTALGVATIVFVLLHAMPGDPVDVMLGESATPADRTALRTQLGLDRPVLEQYAAFMSRLAHADLGRSLYGGRPVAAMIANRYPSTLLLTFAALAVALTVAVPLGILSAAKADGFIDHVALAASLVGVAIPNFWLGPMLILLFAVELGWLPVSGTGSAAHIVLPAATLGLAMAGVLTRMTRATVLETMHEEYVRTARAKGASESRVLWHHALANAATPMLSVLGLQFGSLLAGSVITETIFSWPGLGRLTLEAIQTRDYPVVQGCVLVIALSYVTVNVLTDLAYAWADPRIRVAR